jgi:radical SAM superfamily enzyme YgiQ (UPF0313 family)
MKVVLINPYELGRQPFGLAQPAAWLRDAGFEVRCIDLAVEALEPSALAGAGLVALHLPMHTATRIALEALPRVRALAPRAALAAFGLYAPVNAELLGSLGVGTLLGGEIEGDLLAVAERLRQGLEVKAATRVSLERLALRVPARDTLPALEHYARLIVPGGAERRMAFTEASRGCKHLCRHCPVVPIYSGRFRAVPRDVVLADVRAQVEQGAEHVSFGDPDFFNGPTHALRVAEALHAAFPDLTYDATIKVEHLVAHADLLPRLRETGCVLIVSAFESVDDGVLERLAKGHTRADLDTALGALAAAGIEVCPTFIPFTPWTTLEGFVDLLDWLATRGLAPSVPPVQLALRLLIPGGSHLLHLEEMRAIAEPFDPHGLGHPWSHPDPRVDALQRRVQAIAERAEAHALERGEAFRLVWGAANEHLGREAPALPEDLGSPGPHHSEGWYCCAEPTARQIAQADGGATV